jgi:hypothetical protein
MTTEAKVGTTETKVVLQLGDRLETKEIAGGWMYRVVCTCETLLTDATNAYYSSNDIQSRGTVLKAVITQTARWQLDEIATTNWIIQQVQSALTPAERFGLADQLAGLAARAAS